MYKHNCPDGTPAPPNADAVGIVVNDGGRVSARPRTVAFVWGKRVRSAPTLPYGRWKKDVRSAA